MLLKEGYDVIFFLSVTLQHTNCSGFCVFFFFFKSILRVHFPERFSFNICKSQHLRTVIIVFVLCLICLQTYCSRMCFKVSQNKWKLLDADVQLLCLLLLGFFFRKLLHDLLRNVCSHFFLYISNLE